MASESLPMWDVLSIGEARAEFLQQPDSSYLRRVGGDASDVARAVVRMGGQAAVAGCIGSDDFGDAAMTVWRGEGVDARLIRRDPKARTAHGFDLRDERPWMHRTDSAGGRFRPGDLPASRVARARVLHASGVSLGLSASCRVAVEIAAEQAQACGALVSFAPIFDRALWDAETAVSAMLDMVRRCNILFLRPGEARLLIGAEPPEVVLQRLLSLGPQVVVMGWDTGAWLATPQSKRFARMRADLVTFPTQDLPWAVLIGTYLSGLTAGEDLMATARRAVQAAVLAAQPQSGIPSLPSLEDLQDSAARNVA